MLGNGVRALVAERRQLADQSFAVDPLAFGHAAGELANPERRQDPLGGTVGGGDDQLRPGLRLLQRVQRRQPLGHHPKRRRGAVVRQAVPRRQGEDLDLGREQGDGVRQRPHRRFVRGDDDRPARLCPAVCGAGKVSREPRQEPGRDARQGQRLTRAEDLLKRLAHRAIGM